MATPFAYNTGSTIAGTTQIGDIAVGDTAQDYSSGPGGVQWYMGPSENTGYVVARVDEAGGHTTHSENAKLAFRRSEDFTNESFTTLVNGISLETGGTGVTSSAEASIWLEEQEMFINTGYCQEYQTLYDSWTNKPGVALSAAYNILFNKLKGRTAKGINFFNKFDLAWLFGTHTNNGGEALKNIVNPGTNDATMVNAPYFNNFSGFKGDAVSRYIQTFWNAVDDGNKFVLDDSSFGVYGLDVVEDVGYKYHGSNSVYDLAIFTLGNGRTYGKINNTGGPSVVATDPRGLRVVRNFNNTTSLFYGGVYTDLPQTTGGFCDVDLRMLSYTNLHFTDERIGFGYVGSALTEAEAQELESILDWWFNFEWLTLGEEMIYNGDMAIHTGGVASGVTPTNGITTIVTGNGFPGNAQRHEADLTENTFARIYEYAEVDKYYLLEFKCRNNNGCTFYFGGRGTNVGPSTTAQTIRTVVKATSTIELRMYVRSSSGDAQAGDWVEYSNITLKEIIGLTT